MRSLKFSSCWSKTLTVQTHDSDAIRFHRFEWACCSVWKYHFQTIRDDTKQSDWPLPGKIAPHWHRIQPFPTFIGRVAQNGGLRHNGLAPVEMHGFRISRRSSRCHGFAPLGLSRYQNYDFDTIPAINILIS